MHDNGMEDVLFYVFKIFEIFMCNCSHSAKLLAFNIS